MAGTRHFAGLGAALLSALVLVTGCGSGEGAAGSDLSGTAPASEGAKAEPGTAGGGDQGGDTRADGRDEAATQGDTQAAGGPELIPAGPPAPGGAELDPLAFAGRDVVFTADLSVQVEDVASAITRAEGIVVAAGGLVAGEETSRNPDSPATAQGRLTVRVPAAAFRSTLAALAALGTPISQTQTAQDVTEEVTDLDSRVATQRASVERVRALLAEAKVIADIVSIEGELARREAELESLQARRARLGDLTTLSTITATFTGPGVEPVVAAGERGFLAGFGEGWAAFKSVVVVMLTVLGAVLPFVLVGAAVGLPLLALRRRRHTTPPQPAEAVTAGQGAG
jgi:hypothetical protein